MFVFVIPMMMDHNVACIKENFKYVSVCVCVSLSFEFCICMPFIPFLWLMISEFFKTSSSCRLTFNTEQAFSTLLQRLLLHILIQCVQFYSLNVFITILTFIRCYNIHFYPRQLYRQVLLRARISYGNSVCPSVCPSVTTRYGFNARWDKDSGSSPYSSLEYLVSYEVIWCQWVKRVPSNGGIKEGYPP